MKAAILHEAGQPMVIEDVALDAPQPDEVRIRVVASGLCHSDYHYLVGDLACPLPALLGHEASGIVEAVGENVRHLKPGDAVVAGAPFCGDCGQCTTGHTHRCDARPVRPGQPGKPRITLRGQPVYQFTDLGGFAEEMLVHSRGVVKTPEGMPLDLAALLGCAVLTGVGAAVNRAAIRPGQSVAVIGCGGVGLNVIQGARIAGAGRIVAVDINPAKLELAKVFGATDVVAGGEDAVAEVQALTRGGVDYAFEVIGLKETVRQGFMMLRKGGAIVLVGVPKGGTELSFPATPFFRNEVRVISTLMGSSPLTEFIPKLAAFYMDGKLKLDPLVSQRIALKDINRGYDQLAAGEVARSLITFDA
jgi:S-(hydroxymethyl)glutathione dehydrogenase/alcohol dehydrogenase